MSSRQILPAIGKNFVCIRSTRIERLGCSRRHCVGPAWNEAIGNDMTNPGSVAIKTKYVVKTRERENKKEYVLQNIIRNFINVNTSGFNSNTVVK